MSDRQTPLPPRSANRERKRRRNPLLWILPGAILALGATAVTGFIMAIGRNNGWFSGGAPKTGGAGYSGGYGGSPVGDYQPRPILRGPIAGAYVIDLIQPSKYGVSNLIGDRNANAVIDPTEFFKVTCFVDTPLVLAENSMHGFQIIPTTEAKTSHDVMQIRANYRASKPPLVIQAGEAAKKILSPAKLEPTSVLDDRTPAQIKDDTIMIADHVAGGMLSFCVKLAGKKMTDVMGKNPTPISDLREGESGYVKWEPGPDSYSDDEFKVHGEKADIPPDIRDKVQVYGNYFSAMDLVGYHYVPEIH